MYAQQVSASFQNRNVVQYTLIQTLTNSLREGFYRKLVLKYYVKFLRKHLQWCELCKFFQKRDFVEHIEDHCFCILFLYFIVPIATIIICISHGLYIVPRIFVDFERVRSLVNWFLLQIQMRT